MAGKTRKRDKAGKRAQASASVPIIEPVVHEAIAGFLFDNDELPAEIEERAFRSGSYPYEEKLKKKEYESSLQALQIELLKLQAHIRAEGERLVVLFEGRDAAGKGGTINRFIQHLNPRHARVVALSKPTEAESGQWYFQRYVQHLPTRGDIVLLDRSWYNRAGVERVMSFAGEDQVAHFLREVPVFERMLVEDGITLVKLWLDVGQEMQIKRFHDRRHDPLKHWKLSPIDIQSLGRWDAYTRARDAMFAATHSAYAPWTIIRANDKYRARLNAMRHVLGRIEYAGRDPQAVGEVDGKIVLSGDAFAAG